MQVNKGVSSVEAAIWVVPQEQDNMVLKLGQSHLVYLCFLTIISVSVCFVWPTSQKVPVLKQTRSEKKAAIQPFVMSQTESMHVSCMTNLPAYSHTHIKETRLTQRDKYKGT